MNDPLILGNQRFQSRLLLGSGHYPDHKTLVESIEASETEIVTVSIRRLSPNSNFKNDFIKTLKDKKRKILPNTAGCFTAHEAILTAKLAREALENSWIKLEVIGDEKTLLPNVTELVKAAEELVREGFTVLPYCNDDLITCLKLMDLGCAAVMPLGSMIGSGMGILNPYNLRILRERISIPLILDAGVGTPSDVVEAMELGFDGVLVNTAIAQARNPVSMALAMKLACEAGRLAYCSGRISQKHYAVASSPFEGLILHANS